MSDRAPASRGGGRLTAARRRILALVLLTVGLAAVASLDDLHAWLIGLLPVAEAVIRDRPVSGVSIFVLLAALSAMLAFVSSAVIVPVAVYTWGPVTTLLLLWLGWILGGICAYAASRYLGRPAARSVLSGPVLERYEDRISHGVPFGLVLLFQIAMPSEVPGYLLGLVRYRFWKFLAALALAELPYAVATVYLGASFIERRMYLLVGLGVALASLSGGALYLLHRRLWRRPA